MMKGGEGAPPAVYRIPALCISLFEVTDVLRLAFRKTLRYAREYNK